MAKIWCVIGMVRILENVALMETKSVRVKGRCQN
uniref:Uncharacterized protein n=1 Tax=Brassica oleracea TaxID=3712 RepID=A0A3P6B4V0_BRAOL|nr:unnamed protein product [Brassica oleracea]